MLEPVLKKNDSQARLLIGVFSFVVFAAVVLLSRFTISVNLGFNVHIFALLNAIINSVIAVLLVLGLITVKQKKFALHKNIMFAALILSVLFLVFYITHHLLAGEAIYGDSNLNGLLDESEKLAVADTRVFYLIILITHIFLAAVILPFILFTAYRALISEYAAHKKLAKYTWPLWLYVAITGPVVYWLISPYYR